MRGIRLDMMIAAISWAQDVLYGCPWAATDEDGFEAARQLLMSRRLMRTVAKRITDALWDDMAAMQDLEDYRCLRESRKAELASFLSGICRGIL